MKEQVVKNAYDEKQKASIKAVEGQQLCSGGIERDGKDYRFNAFAILNANGEIHVQRDAAYSKAHPNRYLLIGGDFLGSAGYYRKSAG